MEKLQAALDKARKTRQSGGVISNRTAPDAKRANRPAGVDALWQDLAPLSLDRKALEQHRVVTQVANNKAAPFDILSTKVLLQMRQNGWKRLAITSPMPRSGKTTTACNLALSLGRQSDLRTMLFDLDLREPSVDSFFDHTPEKGIADVIAGKVDIADQAVRIGDNVAVAMTNRVESDPARLLLAEETAEVIDGIERDYQPDIMIFDMPSMLVNDDTRAFLKNVDCVLIIIRANKTKYSQFDVSEREIAEQTNVLGVVLNAYQNSNFHKSGA